MLEMSIQRAERWRTCMVSLLDMANTKKAAESGQASQAMVRMHAHAAEKINSGMGLHCNGYIWNDSILLLSFHTKSASDRAKVLSELAEFKNALEQDCDISTYCISVQGKSFPFVGNESHSAQAKAIVIRASSWAMANCYLIESALKKHRASWYIDSRILNGIPHCHSVASKEVKLLPLKRRRTIYMFKDSPLALNCS